ncbi:hypothetical protein G9A89_019191 [Geosiphon pyriformis]|nr:hypothetical protein G9A89_019191 [Geosiphon pyriformis]
MFSNNTSSNRSYEQGDSKEPPSVGNYFVGVEIGRGSFATVYKGHHKKTHAVVAIKSVSRSKLTKKLLENLESEITILKGIRHNHIVQLVDCQKSDTHIHLIMEYCSLGDLSNYIKRRGDLKGANITGISVAPSRAPPSGLSEYVVFHFLKQLANALEFLRSQNLIHRDIKPQNLLLLPPPTEKEKVSWCGSPDLPILKIADFGFARLLPATSLAETLCGSPLYMAPEILRYEKYDAKADLWSVGAVLYEMIVGKPPFRAQNHVELLGKIEKRGDRIKFPGDSFGVVQSGNPQVATEKLSLNTKSTPNISGQTFISDEIKDLIRQLLKKNPVERISFEEFFMNPCVAGELQPQSPIISSKAKSSYDQKSKSKNSIRVNNSNHDFDHTNQYSKERSISSPVAPLNPQDGAIGKNLQTKTCQTQSKTNGLRKDIEGLLPKGIGNATELSPAPQRKNSKEIEKPRQLYQRSSRYPLSTGNPGLGLHSSYEKYVESKGQDINFLNAPESGFYYDGNSPSSSLMVQKLEKDSLASKKRHTYNGVGPIDGNLLRLNSEEEEVLLAREYVVVEEKSTIEINALADVIRNITKHGNLQIGSSSPVNNDAPYRRQSPIPDPSATYFYSTTPPFALPVPSHARSQSTRSNGSATSALARALSITSERLFGTGNSPPHGNDKSSKAKGNAIGSSGSSPNNPKEEAVIKNIEDAARKACVVYEFADNKFYRLLPPPPTASNDLDVIPLSEEAALVLAEEALVLYVKALSLLKAAMDSANQYWHGNNAQQNDYPGMKVASPKLNDVVQWVRSRYNECLERAEYAKSRCHSEDFGIGAVAEKLLYDRALEMSRQAALNELVSEDLPGCERSYKSAIDMLNAVLDNAQEDDDNMDEDDRRIVNKFIISINNRLNSLQKKWTQSEAAAVTTTAGSQGSPG